MLRASQRPVLRLWRCIGRVHAARQRFGRQGVATIDGQGDLRPELDPALTARLLFGTVNSLTEWLKPGRTHDGAALADALTALAFDGLRTQPARPAQRPIGTP